jgi:acyl-CoA reductase-like NAD-dependent aldehyde dehydrogenase
VEFPVLDDHPQSVAGAGRGLHRGAQAANETPLTRWRWWRWPKRPACRRACFNILTGNSSAIGKVLCEHPAVRFVGFTGSTEVGKILYQQAAVGGEEARA